MNLGLRRERGKNGWGFGKRNEIEAATDADLQELIETIFSEEKRQQLSLN